MNSAFVFLFINDKKRANMSGEELSERPEVEPMNVDLPEKTEPVTGLPEAEPVVEAQTDTVTEPETVPPPAEESCVPASETPITESITTDETADDCNTEEAPEKEIVPGPNKRLTIGIKLPKVNVILTRCDDKVSAKTSHPVNSIPSVIKASNGQSDSVPIENVIPLDDAAIPMEEDGSEKLDLLNTQEGDINSKLDTSE